MPRIDPEKLKPIVSVEAGPLDPLSIENLEAEFLKGSQFQQTLQRQIGQTAVQDPSVQPGPGFIELPQPGRTLTKEEAAAMTLGNVMRQHERTFRTLPLDVAVKGTLSYQLGKAVTTGKRARGFKITRGVKMTRFAVANALGDAVAETALQGLEVKLGYRNQISPGEVAFSAGSSLGVGIAAPFIIRMAGRVGKIAPRDIKEFMFSRFGRQIKLLWPKVSFIDPTTDVMSAEFRLGKKFLLRGLRNLKGAENRALRELADDLGESIGVVPEHYGLPSAIRNVNILEKTTKDGVRISIKPFLNDAFGIATAREAPVASFRRATNEAVNFLAEVEKKYASQGLMLTPQQFNQFASDLEDRALGSIIRMSQGRGQALAAPLAREAESNAIYFRMHQSARKIMTAEMDAYTGGAWSRNRAITSKVLTNSENMVRHMSGDKVVDFVANASENEPLMAMVREFDEINKTNFTNEIYELFLSRQLSGGRLVQTQPVTGFARSIAPFLVLMTQLTKIFGLSVSPVSAFTGSAAAGLVREEKRQRIRFKRSMAAQKLDLERLESELIKFTQPR